MATAAAVLAVAVRPAAAVPGADSSPPSSPSADAPPANAAQAQSAAHAAARRVEAEHARVGAAARRVTAASRAADRAQTRFEHQLAVQREAAASAARAAAAARVTERAYVRDHAAFVHLLVTQYVSGGDVGALGSLLTAKDPGSVLAAAEEEQLLAQQRASVVDQAQATAAANDAAQARRSATLAAERRATATLATVRDRAARALQKARSGLHRIQHDLAAARIGQASAEAVLSQFLGGWSLADPSRADALNRQYLGLARQMAARPAAPRTRHWTAAMGQSVVWRALLRIGTPYAWDGGNASGATRGVCAGGGAENDCHVIGFDCSGLALFAWAHYLVMPHSAAAQYATGHVHPSPTQLEPGDLVFWSGDGRVAGIHHVALYVGDGNVLQAPNSGDIVRVTPLGSVDSGYFGATRPLT